MDTDRSTPAADAAGREFAIGVCDEAFQVYARIVMRGAAGARRMESDLVQMGFEPVSIGSSALERGCDVLVTRRAAEPVALG